MKHVVLTDEEQDLLEAIERGEFVSVKNVAKAKKDAIVAAKNTINKTRNINIRLSEKTLAKLKSKAIAEGMPYQTLVSSVLHKFATL
jgi:predicted DNA binding CopG/RHH family protein